MFTTTPPHPLKNEHWKKCSNIEQHLMECWTLKDVNFFDAEKLLTSKFHRTLMSYEPSFVSKSEFTGRQSCIDFVNEFNEVLQILHSLCKARQKSFGHIQFWSTFWGDRNLQTTRQRWLLENNMILRVGEEVNAFVIKVISLIKQRDREKGMSKIVKNCVTSLMDNH